MSSLSSNLTKIKNATDVIRTAVSMPDDDISDVATAVSSLGDKNAFSVSSIAEMKALTATEGDICTVRDLAYVGWDLNTVSSILYFPQEVSGVNFPAYSVVGIYNAFNPGGAIGTITVDPNGAGGPGNAIGGSTPGTTSPSSTSGSSSQSGGDDPEPTGVGEIVLSMEIPNFRKTESLKLYVVYELEDTTAYLTEISYSLGTFNYTVADGIVRLPVNLKLLVGTAYSFPVDLSKIIKTFDTVAWDPLTYSSYIIFNHSVPSTTKFSSPAQLRIVSRPYASPCDAGSGAAVPFIINIIGSSVSVDGSFKSADFPFYPIGLSNTSWTDNSGTSAWSISELSLTSFDETLYAGLNLMGPSYDVPIRMFGKHSLFNDVATDGQVSEEVILKLCTFFKTYRDGECTNYIYKDGKWNILYESF